MDLGDRIIILINLFAAGVLGGATALVPEDPFIRGGAIVFALYAIVFTIKGSAK